jgi:hypothetical protein
MRQSFRYDTVKNRVPPFPWTLDFDEWDAGDDGHRRRASSSSVVAVLFQNLHHYTTVVVCSFFQFSFFLTLHQTRRWPWWLTQDYQHELCIVARILPTDNFHVAAVFDEHGLAIVLWLFIAFVFLLSVLSMVSQRIIMNPHLRPWYSWVERNHIDTKQDGGIFLLAKLLH